MDVTEKNLTEQTKVIDNNYPNLTLSQVKKRELKIIIGANEDDSIFPIEIYLDGQKIEHLRRFKFESSMADVPVMEFEQLLI